MKQFRQLLSETLLQEPDVKGIHKATEVITSSYAGGDGDKPYGESTNATERRIHLIQKMRKAANLAPEKKEPEEAPKQMFKHDPSKPSGPKVDFRESSNSSEAADFDGKDPPNVVIFKRRSIRSFSNDQRVALYYSDVLKKELAIPYSIKHKVKSVLNTSH